MTCPEGFWGVLPGWGGGGGALASIVLVVPQHVRNVLSPTMSQYLDLILVL